MIKAKKTKLIVGIIVILIIVVCGIFYFRKNRIHKAGFNILPYYVAETFFILAIYSRNVFRV